MMIYAAHRISDDGERWAVLMLDTETLICPRVRIVAVVTPRTHGLQRRLGDAENWAHPPTNCAIWRARARRRPVRAR